MHEMSRNEKPQNNDDGEWSEPTRYNHGRQVDRDTGAAPKRWTRKKIAALAIATAAVAGIGAGVANKDKIANTVSQSGTSAPATSTSASPANRPTSAPQPEDAGPTEASGREQAATDRELTQLKLSLANQAQSFFGKGDSTKAPDSVDKESVYTATISRTVPENSLGDKTDIYTVNYDATSMKQDGSFPDDELGQFAVSYWQVDAANQTTAFEVYTVNCNESGDQCVMTYQHGNVPPQALATPEQRQAGANNMQAIIDRAQRQEPLAATEIPPVR